MRWSRVCLESLAYVLPHERVSSRALEDRLAPLYDTLRLAPGQLEALTGIQERRYWPPGTAMSDVAAQAGELAGDGLDVDAGPAHQAASITRSS
jgi:3-oxoacyl-[acyl-carrier-protein] synthase-3